MSPIIYVACVAGILGRTVVPYLQTLRDEPNTQFDRKFLVPAVISLVLSLLTAPFVLGQLPSGADWIAAFVFGWGANDISREAIKLAGANIQALGGLK